MTRKRGSFNKKIKTAVEQIEQPASRKPRHAKDNAPTDEELEKMYSACENPFDRVVISLCGYCGMRESEVAHCKKAWVNFQERTVEIPISQPCECGECTKLRGGMWYPKTKVGARTVPIRENGIEAIKLFFEYDDAIKCSRQTIYNRVKEIARISGITKRVHPHALRSAYASYWGQNGMSTPNLLYIMGWKKIETGNRYVTTDKRVAIKMAKMIEGGKF